MYAPFTPERPLPFGHSKRVAKIRGRHVSFGYYLLFRSAIASFSFLQRRLNVCQILLVDFSFAAEIILRQLLYW